MKQPPARRWSIDFLSSASSIRERLAHSTIHCREAGPFHVLITTWTMSLSNHLSCRSHVLFVDKIACNVHSILTLSREHIPVDPFLAVGTSVPPLQQI
jgi:hypothetical protein